MPQPTARDVHINRPLTNMSVAYVQQQNTYIADVVFPSVPVQNQGDVYWKYPKGEWYRTVAQKRAPGTESVGSGWTLTQDEYFAHVYAVHKDLDDQILANADAQLNIDRDAVRFVTNQLLLKRDLLWASTYFGTSIWGTDRTGVSGTPSGTQFKQFDQAGSTPIQTILDSVTNMEEATGFRPNTLVVGPRVHNTLLNHADLIDRIKYTQRGVITEELLASLLGIDRYVIARPVQNTAQEGATDALSFIYGKKMLLTYSNPTPSLMTPSAGYTFSWAGFLGAGALGIRMKRFRMEHLESERIEGEMAFDMKVVASDLGIFFDSAVS